MMDGLPALGVGLGFRPPLKAAIFRRRDQIDFLEITLDHYLEAPPEKMHELDLLIEHFPLVAHGLDLSLGSAEGLDQRYLDQIAALIEKMDPPWWSEHVAFTRAGGVEIGHLAPLPFTEEALDALCRNIETAQRTIPRPLIVENITYPLALGAAEMSEAAFLAKLGERSGCGLLLDATNLFINSERWGYDPAEFLATIPCEGVVQLHFVGAERSGDGWADSHRRPVNEEVWQVLERVLASCPAKGAILERDADFPQFDDLLGELQRAREIGGRYGRWET